MITKTTREIWEFDCDADLDKVWIDFDELKKEIENKLKDIENLNYSSDYHNALNWIYDLCNSQEQKESLKDVLTSVSCEHKTNPKKCTCGFDVKYKGVVCGRCGGVL